MFGQSDTIIKFKGQTTDRLIQIWIRRLINGEYKLAGSQLCQIRHLSGGAKLSALLTGVTVPFEHRLIHSAAPTTRKTFHSSICC